MNLKAAFTFFLTLAATTANASDLLNPQGEYLTRLPEVKRVGKSLRFESVPGSEPFTLEADREIGPLLPNQFRVAWKERAQPLADQLTLRIFESASARKALCFVASQSASDVSHFLGVSSQAAQSIQATCRSTPLSGTKARLFATMKNSILGGPTQQPPKRYTFVFTDQSQPKIEGFTAREGTTLVAVNSREANEAHLIRIMTHEIAMSFDQLSRLSPRHHTSPWDEGLRDVFGGSWQSESAFHDPAELSELRCALADPAIRYGAAAERAFRFEDKVIAEIGLAGRSRKQALVGECALIIGQRALQVSPLSRSLESEISWGGFREQCGVDLLKDANRTQTLAERIRLVARTELTFKSDGRQLSLCSVILNPQIGPRQVDRLRHAGPRPRAGGW